MTLEIADTLVKNTQLTEAEIRLELAVSLYFKKRLSLSQASELADLPLSIFKKWVSQYTSTAPKKISLQLDVETFPKNLDDFATSSAELSALSELFKNEPSAEELCKML